MESADYFDKHFCNMTKEIQSKMPRSNNNFSDYLNGPVKNTFFINPTTTGQVESQIQNLKNNKIIDSISISLAILKKFRKLSNLSICPLLNAKFLITLKIAKGIPVFTKSKRNTCI